MFFIVDPSSKLTHTSNGFTLVYTDEFQDKYTMLERNDFEFPYHYEFDNYLVKI